MPDDLSGFEDEVRKRLGIPVLPDFPYKWNRDIVWFWDDKGKRLWKVRPFKCWDGPENKALTFVCPECNIFRCVCLDKETWFDSYRPEEIVEFPKFRYKQPIQGPYR